jgi:hypothetical protein
MFFLTKGLPVLLELGLLVYCLVECIQTPSDRVRNLPKLGWIALIVVLPLIGSVGWLLAGRPVRPGGPGSWPGRGRVVGPDDDPDFLAGLDRDERLRDRPDDGPPPDDAGPAAPR